MQKTLFPDLDPPPARPTRIKDLPAGEQPRERLSWLGPQALSGAELLSVLLGGGTAEENGVQLGARLLQEFGGLPGLHRASLDELVQTTLRGGATAIAIRPRAFGLSPRIPI